MRGGPLPRRMTLVGTALVLALVVLQPIALGFFPVTHLGPQQIGREAASLEQDAPPSTGVIGTGVMGTGDMTAGALSSLIRDLNTDGAVPPHARSVSPVVLVLLANVDRDAALRRRALASLPAALATTRGGTSAHGYPLLL